MYASNFLIFLQFFQSFYILFIINTKFLFVIDFRTLILILFFSFSGMQVKTVFIFGIESFRLIFFSKLTWHPFHKNFFSVNLILYLINSGRDQELKNFLKLLFNKLWLRLWLQLQLQICSSNFTFQFEILICNIYYKKER